MDIVLSSDKCIVSLSSKKTNQNIFKMDFWLFFEDFNLSVSINEGRVISI